MRRRNKFWQKSDWQGKRQRRQFDIQKFLASIIVISLPLMIFCLSANLIMRMDDIYEYNMDASGIMNNTNLSTSKEDVVGSITKFMQHRTDDFSLMENVEYEPQQLYSEKDRGAMLQTRHLLDVMLAIGVLMFVASAIAYFFLIRWRVRDIFMKRFKLTFVIFLIMEAANILIVSIQPLRKFVFGSFIEMDFPDDDNLVYLLSDSFPMQIAVFEAIIGIILMLILTYITWQVAGRRKMFKRF